MSEYPGRLYGRIDRMRVYSYADLANKPTINGIPLAEGLFGQDLNLATTYFKTTAEWARLPVISEKNALYVYTDYEKRIDEEGKEYYIAGFKIGDGNAYVSDLPFQLTITDAIIETAERAKEHMASASIHVSDEDRLRWDNKVSASVNEESETLLLSTL